jgi:formyl-CoA transferase/CoA:oxalate CoA-transferase
MSLLRPMLGAMSREQIMLKLAEAEIPAGPILTVGEVLETPHLRAREMIQELTHPEYGPIRVLGIPVKLSDTPGIVEGPPPYFGEHNSAVMSMLGYSADVIATLSSDGVLSRGCPS